MTQKPDLIITGPCMEHAHRRFDENFTTHNFWEADDKSAFIAQHQNTRFLAAASHAPIDGAFMDSLPALEVISNYGVGVDTIDLQAARARGIRVTNTPEVLTDAVAEFAMGLLLATCRRIVDGDRFVRDGKWEAEKYPLTGELNGATVGILGMGRIGKEIAQRCQAFRMRVVYHGRQKQKSQPFVYYSDLVEMARDVDWLIAVVPGDTGTVGIVSRDVLEALGPTGGLINVGRGTAVDEAAMLELLQTGGLGAAGLDVFAKEPKMDPAFWSLENVVLAPHQASATHKTRTAMADLFVDNLIAHRDGDPLITPVV